MTISAGWPGYNRYGNIANCYTTGSVSGEEYVGGLVGRKSGGDIYNCYFLDTSGPDNGFGTPLTDTQMKQQNSFVGWDFVNETANGTCNYWLMPQSDYPVLSLLNGYIPPKPNGRGTENDPYVITDANGLGTIWYRPDAHYRLANNINLTGISWSMAVVPEFSGVFDGDGFSIENLSINGWHYVGLFSVINRGGTVKNLGIENCSINGYNYVGGLAGYNYGTITNCYATGLVSGDDDVGGLAGYNSGDISNCYASGSVSGVHSVGGLAGDNLYDNISNCYATGSVTGNVYVGGLVGKISTGIIINCYATGSVNGSDYVGGFVGYNYRADIDNCYFLDTSGPDNGYGTPLTDAQMKQQSSFIGWDFDTPIWELCPETNDYPHLWWEYYCNVAPVAIAGPNQIAYAFIDGFADVNLDGSASYDDDNDLLDYYWSWTIDANLYEANGVSPTIQLPVGEHQIELIVDDGRVLSEPNFCTIEVVEPLRTKLWLWPAAFNCNARPNRLTTMMYLPKDIGLEDINNQPLTMYPCDIQSKYRHVFRMNYGRCPRTVVMAVFDKDEICEALDTGWHKVEVAGRLHSGRYFYGSNIIRIYRPYPHKWPFRRFYRP